MKVVNAILILLFVLILINIGSPSNNIQKMVKVNEDKPKLDNSNSNVTDNTIISVSDESKLIKNRGKLDKEMPHFPIPQTTSENRSLSTNYPEDLSIINQGATISNSDVIVELRNNGTLNDESHFPKYYKQDNLSANTIGTTEYKFAETDNLLSSNSWSDKNVSQYPGFYSSQLKDEITNVGAFFDVNNNFVDTTRPRSVVNVGEICFKTSEGEPVCLDNSRNYNPPPALISNKNNCGFLNSIGLLEFSNRIYEGDERVNNGGYLYGNVKGSKKHNEVYSKPIQPQVLQCNI